MPPELCRMIDGKFCVSSKILQEVMAVSHNTLGNWSVNGCPKTRPGWWPLADVLRWKGMGGANKPGEASDAQLKLKYEAEIKRLTSEKLDLANAIARGEYLKREEVVADLSRHFTELKHGLMGLSRRVSTEISLYTDAATARKIESDLGELIGDALTALSRGELYAPEEKAGTGALGRVAAGVPAGVSATGAIDGHPVG